MKIGVVAIAAALSTFAATSAQAQWADLNGQYRCVENCLGPGYAFITQQGWDMNMLDRPRTDRRQVETAVLAGLRRLDQHSDPARLGQASVAAQLGDPHEVGHLLGLEHSAILGATMR